MVALVLYQPDIALNTGAMARTCACLGAPMHIIEPCGFPFVPARFRRAAMDYLDHAEWLLHASEEAFFTASSGRRKVLMTTKGAVPLQTFAFRPDDMIVIGRETAGVPPEFAARCESRVYIPMRPGLRSMNAAAAAAVALWEASRAAAGVNS